MGMTKLSLRGLMFVGLALPGIVLADSWTILSHNRNMSAISTARIDAAQVSESDTDSAIDLGLFDAEVQASAFITDNDPQNPITADASSRATQVSVLASNRITVSGFVAGTAFPGGTGSFAETDAFSDLSVQFEVSEPAAVKLTGSAESFDFGQVNVSLAGAVTLILDTVQGLNDFREFDEVWMLDPGVYTFSVRTFADSAAGGFVFDGQSAVWDLELALLACPGPTEPTTFTNVLYAVEGGSNLVHRNLNLAGGASWESPGAMGVDQGGGMAVHPTTQVVHSLVDIAGTQFLVTIDPITGSLSSSVPVSNTDGFGLPQLTDIAFRSDGTMYCLYETIFPGLGKLGIVDPLAGSVSSVGFGFMSFNPVDQSLAFDPAGGLLYLAGGTTLRTIDVDTGIVTPVAIAPAPVFSSIAFHPSGTPFIACTDAGAIVQIFPGTGIVTALPGAADAPVPLAGLDYLASLTLGGGKGVCVPADGDLGDTNGDGQVSAADVSTFIDCLTGPASGIPSQSACLHADMQTDGDVDLADFDRFSIVLTNP
ncbi:MAG: hypothetical protein GXP29_09785 [Planctomycetes bacterium]|nr:hypothetical protein [Planctomycetota bacterium]